MKGAGLKRLGTISRRLRRRDPDRDLAMSTILSSIGEGFVVFDRELRFRIWNSFMEQLTGLSTEEVVGKKALDVFPELREGGVPEHLARVLGGESVESADTPFRTPFAGREGWVVARYHPHRNAAGEIVGVIATVRDVSDRKRAEWALAASDRELAIHSRIADVFLTAADEEIYEMVLEIVLEALDSSHGVFGFIDAEGSLVCPSMTREVFGECQMSDKTIVFPRESWGGIWGRSLTTKTSILSNSSGQVPEGHIAIDRCVFVPIVDRDEVIGLLAVANRSTDYTEEDRVLMESITGHIGPILHARMARDKEEQIRVRAEEAVRVSEERYRAVVEQQTELVERFTQDGTVTFANDAMCRFFGVTRRDLIGTRFHPLMNDEDRDATERHLAQLSPENPIGVNEVPCVTPNGTMRWLSWTNQALFDEEGKIVEYQAVGRDITEQRRAANDLRRALDEKDVLLREIHHRVKNNMAVISSMISLQGDDASPREAGDVLARVRGRIRAMALVHEQMYRSGDFRNVDLGEYADSLVNDLHQTHSRLAPNVRLQTRIADVAMNIDVAIPCGLILNELISNSFEHAFPDDRRGEIVVFLDHCDDARVELGVMDNGVGSHEDLGPGRSGGFGLQLVDLLAQQLGGELEMTFEGGADIRVRFSLDEQ